MNRKVKIVSVLIIVLFLTSLLASCTKDDSKESAAPSTAATAAPEESAAVAATDSPTAAPAKTLKVTAARPAVYPIKNDQFDKTLEALVQQGLAAHTGGTTLDITWSNAPSGQTNAQWLQTVVAGNNLPDIVAFQDSYNEADFMDIATKQELFYTITEDMVKQNMPNYVARYDQFGGSLSEALAESAKYVPGGNLNFLPVGFKPNVFSKIPLSFTQNPTYYGFYLRDDILKKVFPNAKSNEELTAVLAQKGELTVEDITGDIPIHNMDDLYQYLVKVKALNEKVGNNPVYPLALTNNSELIDSLQWSINSINGYFWHDPLTLIDPIEKSFVLPFSEQYGKYLKWVNKLYNEKLMDPEIFVMKNNQYHAKAINGEYAVMNWTLPIAKAVETGKAKGYGYRYIPVFYPADMNILNNKVVYANYQPMSMFISKKVKEEDLPAVLKWIDYYMGQEYDDIRNWGSPDWYTGDGADRKYKPEYQDVANWTVYGVTGAKDGAFYGMGNPIPLQNNGPSGTKANPIMAPADMAFIQPYFTVPNAPYLVLPRNDGKILASDNIFNYEINVMYKQTNKDQQIIRTKGWTEGMLYSLPKFTEFYKKWGGEGQKATGLLTEVATGSPSKADAKWAEYVKLAESSGLREAEAEAQQFLADNYNNNSEKIDKPQ